MAISGVGPSSISMNDYVYWRDSDLLSTSNAWDAQPADPRRKELQTFLQHTKTLQQSVTDLQNLFGKMPALPRGSVATSESTAAIGLAPGEDSLGMNSTAAFAGVSAGSVTINKVPISIDPAVDSLADVLQRINSSSADVVATYDASSDRIYLTGEDEDRDLTLTDDSSNFFAAVKLELGSQAPRTSQRAAKNFMRSEPVQDSIKSLGKAMLQFNQTSAYSQITPDITKHLDDLKTVVRETVSDTLFHVGYKADSIDTNLGMVFDWKNSNPLKFSGPDFEVAAKSAPRRLESFLNSSGHNGSPKGLLARLESFLAKVEGNLSAELGSTGNLVNIRA